MKSYLSIFLSCFFPLLVQAQGKLVPQTGHNGSFCMVLSPDDKKLLTAGLDGRIMLWDVSKTKALQNFKPFQSSIYCAAWKQDGSLFAVGTSDSMIVLFDGHTTKELRRLKTPFVTTEICFNPKHDVLAIGGNNGQVKVLDYQKGDVFFSFQPDAYITGLCFSNNGALLFVAGWNNGVIAYEMNQGKSMMTVPTLEGHHTSGMGLSANNEFLLLHMQDGTTEVINLLQSKKLGSFNSPAYYQDASGSYYLEPALTSDLLFILSVNNENNFVISHQKKNISQVYNNSFSDAKISSIVPSHDGQFFIIADVEGSMSCVYFNETLFNNESPVLWRKLQNSPERIFRVDFLQHDEVLALTGNGHYEFNMSTGDMHRRDGDSAVVSDREYTARYFMTDKNADTYYYADLLRHTGSEINKGIQKPLAGIAFSRDTQVVALVTGNQRLVIYDQVKQKKLVDRDVSKEAGFTLFNGHLNDLFICKKADELSFINPGGETVQTIKLNSAIDVLNICADTKMTQVYLLNREQKLSCYDMKTGKSLALKGDLARHRTVRMMDLSADGKTLVVSDQEGTRLYRTEDGKSFFSIGEKTDQPFSFAFNQKGNRLAVALENGITELWDLDQKQKILNVLATPQDGMLVYTDDHYYMATREAARQLVFMQGDKAISLANAELTYNRPDKVLEKIGLSDQKLVNAYRFAYERRLKQLKTPAGTESFDVPMVALLNQETLKASTNSNQLSLKIKASDEQKKLSSLRVWLNNVPVFGQNGIALDQKNMAEKEIALELVTGTNRIRFSAVNEDGTESEKQEITVVSTYAKKPDLYLLTIGTSQYKNTAFNLSYAAKDAQDLAAFFNALSKKGESPYGRVQVKTLVNDMVTAENLKKTKSFLQGAGSNDVVMIFVAGHGVRDEQMNYYFGTHDMNFDQPGEKGFSEEDFARLVDGLKAVKKLVFFDTCLSGELDRDEAEQTLAANTPTKNGDVSFRTAGAGVRTKTSGINNASALMREIYNDLDEGTGSTIISSAGGAEYAMESSEWKNGLFTYCFLNGLKNFAADRNGDKQITVSEIQDHVRKEVIRLSKGKQQPSFKDENILMNYRIW